MGIEIRLRRVAVIERLLMQAYQRDVQRGATRLARIREARAAQEPPAEQAIAREHRKSRSGLPGLVAVVRATRGFVTQPS